ncbi:MAG: hypothetical protein ACR2Q4_08350 [Geminicoccaceae bacterium]
MEAKNSDQAANATTPTGYHGPDRRRGKPLGAEKLVAIAAGIFVPVLGGMWFSMHEQIDRLETRIIEMGAKIDNNRSETVKKFSSFLEDASKQRYDYHVETLHIVRQELKVHQEEVQIEMDRLETAVETERDINDQRYAAMGSEVGGLTSSYVQLNGEIGHLLETAAGPE